MVCAGDHLGRGWAGRAGRGGDAGPSGFYDLDVMFSVRAITDSAGLLHTRLDYTPYGVAMHGLAADANGDGSVNTADLGVVSANYNGGNELQPGDTGYDPDAFLDGSDTIVLSDYTGRYSPYVSGGSGPTFNAGWIDNPGDANGPDNSVGYDGYWFDLAGATEATSSGLYMVRYRVYDPRLGRWLQRDPLGYVDGTNLYAATLSSPATKSDPLGLCASGDCTLPAIAPLDSTVVIWAPETNPHPSLRSPRDTGDDPTWENCCVMDRHWNTSGLGIARAFVTCCNGEKIVCMPTSSHSYQTGNLKTPSSSEKNIGLERADMIIDSCRLDHELRHVSQQSISCDGVPNGRPPLLPDPDMSTCEHCEIHKAHLDCLNGSLRLCAIGLSPSAMTSCEEQVSREVKAQERKVQQACANDP